MLLQDSVTGIVLMNVLAVLLVLGRAPLFRTALYRPMLLNVGLSIAPVVVLGAGVLLVAVLLAAGCRPGSAWRSRSSCSWSGSCCSRTPATW